MIKLEKDTANRNLGLNAHECRICGAKGLFQSYLVREMMKGTKDEFEYFVCPECQCLQLSEIPENLADYYGHNYYSMKSEMAFDNAFTVPVSNSSKILDVGCGIGDWLYKTAKEGHDNLFGCDPYIDKDISYGDRVYIKKCDITGIDGTFNTIRMSDSFEHMSNPKEVLESAVRLLEEDGTLVIGIPMYPNIAFDMFETHWYQLDAPRHIFIHSAKSLKLLADECGLEITSFEYNSNNSQILCSFFYQHGISYEKITSELVNEYFTENDLLRIDEVARQANIDKKGDHAWVYFRKKKKVCMSSPREEELCALRDALAQDTPVQENLEIGEFSYVVGVQIFDEVKDGERKVRIGRYCSISDGVIMMLREEHRASWNTTYPFKVLLDRKDEGEPSAISKGDIVIGNDVWIGYGVVVLSGVTIGDGCIIGAETVVSKSVEPYSVVVGNPGRVVKLRFSKDRIDKLLEMKWWNWELKHISAALPLLESEDIAGLYDYWMNNVRGK